jgi:hypothetical protein
MTSLILEREIEALARAELGAGCGAVWRMI